LDTSATGPVFTAAPNLSPMGVGNGIGADRGSMHRGSELGTDAGVRAAYAAHGAELYRFALRGLGDAGLAEDAVQETFLRAWLAAGRYDPARSSLRVWLFAIARNTLVDVRRRRSRLSWVPVAST
jgi:RNA polymerase sigma-70 factor (ECF subfamily)